MKNSRLQVLTGTHISEEMVLEEGGGHKKWDLLYSHSSGRRANAGCWRIGIKGIFDGGKVYKITDMSSTKQAMKDKGRLRNCPRLDEIGGFGRRFHE